MFQNKKGVIGLDISDLNLRAVQLYKSGKKIRIQALSKIDLPKGIIEHGYIKDGQVVSGALSTLLSKPIYGSFSSNKIVACLPETKSFIKLIKIENGPNNLNTIIEAEIEKYIPIAINEMYYDWQIINKMEDGFEVMIGAAPYTIVNQYIDLIKSLKLEISALEIEGMPICRSLLKEESPDFKEMTNSSYCIIDIGAKRTSMIVYAKNTIVFTLSMPISGEEITERISSTLEINRDQAEKAKIICGLDKNNARGIIHEILSEMIKDLIGKLNDSFEYYAKNYPDFPPIKKLILCGGGSNIKNLSEIISSELNIEVTKGNPFININESEEDFGKNLIETHNLKNEKISEIKDKLSIKQNSSISFTTAIGLAERSIFIQKQ